MSHDDNVRNLDDHVGDGRDGVRDDRLSALYRAHLMGAAPSSASDAHVLRLAGEAVTGAGAVAPAIAGAGSDAAEAAPAVAAVAAGVAALARARPAVAATATRSGWRAWLNAPWFGPGLAFATVASLSVMVIALMPKEEMAVEKEVASAPASVAAAAPVSAPTPVSASAPAPASSAASASSSPATTGTLAGGGASNDQALSKSSTASPPSAASSPQANASRAKAATGDARKRSNDASAVSVEPPVRVEASPAGPAEPIRRGVVTERNVLTATPAPTAASAAGPTAAPNSASSMRADVASAVRQERTHAQPNPFPAQPSLATAPVGTTTPPPAPPPTTTFPEGARPEKQSLQSEVTEPRASASIAEVPDSAPTYPNESRPSIPLPYSYTMPRKSRDANGSAAASPRVLDKAEKSSPPLLAAAATHRDPAQWVKAILKLKSEGKIEQWTKELADFRKQYPQYVLPEELRQIR